MPKSLEHLLTKKLVFVSGKGGTGKSSFSTALAALAQSNGLRVLLVEQTGKPILPFFMSEDLTSKVEYLNLGLDNCFKEFVCDYLKQPFLYEKLFNHDSIQTFLRTIPGLPEIMVLGKLFYSMDREKPSNYDIAIFDCPASGHFFNLLMTPQTVLSSGLGGPFLKEVVKINDFIRSDAVTSVLLTLPEPLVVSETIEFAHKIYSKEKFGIGLLLKNKWLQEGALDESLKHDCPVLSRFIEKDLERLKSAEELLAGEQLFNGSTIPQLSIPYDVNFRPPLKLNATLGFLRGLRETI